jgi:hypothetical protein
MRPCWNLPEGVLCDTKNMDDCLELGADSPCHWEQNETSDVLVQPSTSEMLTGMQFQDVQGGPCAEN